MLQDVDVLLLDIEGTITDIAFVHKSLFSYVREHLRSYLDENWANEEIKSAVDALRILSQNEFDKGDRNILLFPEVKNEPADGKEALIDIIVKNVNHWMDLDKKFGPLKQLQGHMWRDAYQTGAVKGHLYSDVVPSLRRILSLTEYKGIKICIYSSGSVLAQKLLFTYSCEGDVTSLLSAYFDTEVGAKTESDSYRRIASTLGVEPNRILFLTDVEREAYPAKEASCKVGIVVRDGNAALSEKAKTEFSILHSLNELF